MPKKLALEGLFAGGVSYFGKFTPLTDFLASGRKSNEIGALWWVPSKGSGIRRVCDSSERIRDALDGLRPLMLQPGLYVFSGHLWEIFKDEQSYDENTLCLLFREALDKEQEWIARLKRKFSGENRETTRERIPADVQIYVWRRDEGKCVQCGSQERLEYDHIIPVIKGGSNTERNIQLLCEACNRKKGDRI